MLLTKDQQIMLDRLRASRQEVEAAKTAVQNRQTLIIKARETGLPWKDIAQAAGITRESAMNIPRLTRLYNK